MAVHARVSAHWCSQASTGKMEREKQTVCLKQLEFT